MKKILKTVVCCSGNWRLKNEFVNRVDPNDKAAQKPLPHLYLGVLHVSILAQNRA